MVDHYKELEISPNATQSEIKKAYRSLALKYHPDKNKETSAIEKFKAIVASYNILSDPAKKSEYDRKASFKNPTSSFGSTNYNSFTSNSRASRFSTQDPFSRSERNFGYNNGKNFAQNFRQSFNRTFKNFYHDLDEEFMRQHRSDNPHPGFGNPNVSSFDAPRPSKFNGFKDYKKAGPYFQKEHYNRPKQENANLNGSQKTECSKERPIDADDAASFRSTKDDSAKKTQYSYVPSEKFDANDRGKPKNNTNASSSMSGDPNVPSAFASPESKSEMKKDTSEQETKQGSNYKQPNQGLRAGRFNEKRRYGSKSVPIIVEDDSSTPEPPLRSAFFNQSSMNTGFSYKQEAVKEDDHHRKRPVHEKKKEYDEDDEDDEDEVEGLFNFPDDAEQKKHANNVFNLQNEQYLNNKNSDQRNNTHANERAGTSSIKQSPETVQDKINKLLQRDPPVNNKLKRGKHSPFSSNYNFYNKAHAVKISPKVFAPSKGEMSGRPIRTHIEESEDDYESINPRKHGNNSFTDTSESKIPKSQKSTQFKQQPRSSNHNNPQKFYTTLDDYDSDIDNDSDIQMGHEDPDIKKKYKDRSFLNDSVTESNGQKRKKFANDENPFKFNVEDLPPFTQNKTSNFNMDNIKTTLDPNMPDITKGVARFHEDPGISQEKYEGLYSPVNKTLPHIAKPVKILNLLDLSSTEDYLLVGPPARPESLKDYSKPSWLRYQESVKYYLKRYFIYKRNIEKYNEERTAALMLNMDNVLNSSKNAQTYSDAINLDLRINEEFIEALKINKEVMENYSFIISYLARNGFQ